MTSHPQAPNSPPRPRDQGQWVRGLIAALSFDDHGREPLIGRGNLAGLRRMDPDRPDAAAFWSLLARISEGEMLGSDDAIRRWALIAHGMALMAPDHHENRIEIGQALRSIGYAEGRLARLLNARGRQFRAIVPRLCRHLAAKRQPLNWVRFAWLILTEGRDEDAAEQVRLRIAREYYRAQAKLPEQREAA